MAIKIINNYQILGATQISSSLSVIKEAS